MNTTASNPLADVNSVSEVEAKVAQAKAVKCWCAQHPDGGTVKDENGNDVYVDADQVRRFISVAEEMITIHAPSRMKYLNEVELHEKHARKVYPDLFKRGAKMRERFRAMLKAFPDVMRFPDYHLILGDCITGCESRTNREAS